MPETHDMGAGFYVQFLKLNRGSPFIHRAPTAETEPPYRLGRSVIIRLWPSTKALVFGRWASRVDDPFVGELRALQLVWKPRDFGPIDWCKDCGRTWCDCDEDQGVCPLCDESWDDCLCLDKVAEKYWEAWSR